jgi:hypothetical protein
LPSSCLSYNLLNSRKAKDFHATSYVQGQRSMCPKPKIPFFLVHNYWGSEVTRLSLSIRSYETSSTRKRCAKAVPETDSFTQQKQYHKRTTLCTLKLPLQSIHSKEGPHYRLGAKLKEAVIRQAINAIWHGYVENPAAKHS